ncbi:MAG: AAA family ATPase, partial [Elusimicrobiota bacterium]
MNTPEDAARIKTMIYKMKIHNVALEEIFNEIESDIGDYLTQYGAAGGLIMYLSRNTLDEKLEERIHLEIEKIAIDLSSPDNTVNSKGLIKLAVEFPALFTELEKQVDIWDGLGIEGTVRLVDTLGYIGYKHPKIKELLKHKEDDIRRSAIRASGTILAEHIRRGNYDSAWMYSMEAMIKKETQPEIVEMVIRALGRVYYELIGTGEFNVARLRAVERKLDFWNEDIRPAVTDVFTELYAELIRQGKLPIEEIEEKLTHHDAAVREIAVRVAGILYLDRPMTEAGNDKLSERLDDEDNTVKKEAVRSQGKVYTQMVINGSADVKTLEGILAKGKNSERQAAALALGNIYAGFIEKNVQAGFEGTEKLKNLIGEDDDLDAMLMIALSHVYAAFIETGRYDEVDLSLIESRLKDTGLNVRKAALEALGRVYLKQIDTGTFDRKKLKNIEDLEFGVLDTAFGVHDTAFTVLGDIYVRLIEQQVFEEYWIGLMLKNIITRGAGRSLAVIDALGRIYSKLFDQQKDSFDQDRLQYHENLLTNTVPDVRLKALSLLKPIYEELYSTKKLSEIVSSNSMNFDKELETATDTGKTNLEMIYGETDSDISAYINDFGPIGGLLMYLSKDSPEYQLDDESKAEIKKIAVGLNFKAESVREANILKLAYLFPEFFIEIDRQHDIWGQERSADKKLRLIDYLTEGYILQIANGKEPDLGKLEEQLKAMDTIAKAAVRALGRIYEKQIEVKGDKFDRSVLNKLLSMLTGDMNGLARADVVMALSDIYLKMIDQGIFKAEDLENIEMMLDSEPVMVTAAAARSLGKLYSSLIEKGKLENINEKLLLLEQIIAGKENNFRVKVQVIKALDSIYSILFEKGALDADKLDILIELLGNSDTDVRQAAVNAITGIYRKYIENRSFERDWLTALENKLSDGKWQVREAAVNILGVVYLELLQNGMQDMVSIDKIESMLNEENELLSSYIREAAFRALHIIYMRLIADGRFDMNKLEKLELRIKNANWHTSRLAESVLQDLYFELVSNGRISEDELEEKLDHPEWVIREASTAALGREYLRLIGEREIEHVLSKLALLEDKLTNDIDTVRKAAVIAVSEIYMELLSNAMLDHAKITLLEDLFKSSEGEVRSELVKAIGSLYLKLLEHEDLELGKLALLEDNIEDSAVMVRIYVVRALEKIYLELIDRGVFDQRKLSILENKLRRGPFDMHEEVVSALGKIYIRLAENEKLDPAKIDILEGYLTNTSVKIRNAAFEMLVPFYRNILKLGYNETISAVIAYNRGRFESELDSALADRKVTSMSPYKIRISKKRKVVEGVVNGDVVVKQPILGEISEEEFSQAAIVESPETARRLIDLFFASSREKLNTLLWLGQTSTGKTSLVRYAAALVGKKFTRVQVNSSMDELDLIGHHQPKGLDIDYETALQIIIEKMEAGEWFDIQKAVTDLLPQKADKMISVAETKEIVEDILYRKGAQKEYTRELVRSLGYLLEGGGIVLEFKKAPFLEALEAGHWILLDEINLAREEALGILYGLLSKGYLEMDGRRIKPKDNGGMIFAAGNLSSDVGRNVFSEAFESRMEVHFTFPYTARETAQILQKGHDVDSLRFEDFENLAELREAVDTLMQANNFNGFEGEQPYRFTLRNLENILRAVNERVERGGIRAPGAIKDIFMKETWDEFAGILRRDNENLETLKSQFLIYFDRAPPERPSLVLDIDEGSYVELDGLKTTGPFREVLDPGKVPLAEDIDLAHVKSTLDDMRVMLKGFRYARRPVSLIGQAASGKSDGIEYLCRLLGWAYHSENMRDNTLRGLVGGWRMNPSTHRLEYEEGVLIKAMTRGWCLVLEEVNFMDPGLVEVISEWIDEGHFTNPVTGAAVKIHDDFRLFTTMNPIMGRGRMSVGRNELPVPFRNRFIERWVEEKSPEEEMDIVMYLWKGLRMFTDEDYKGIYKPGDRVWGIGEPPASIEDYYNGSISKVPAYRVTGYKQGIGYTVEEFDEDNDVWTEIKGIMSEEDLFDDMTVLQTAREKIYRASTKKFKKSIYPEGAVLFGVPEGVNIPAYRIDKYVEGRGYKVQEMVDRGERMVNVDGYKQQDELFISMQDAIEFAKETGLVELARKPQDGVKEITAGPEEKTALSAEEGEKLKEQAEDVMKKMGIPKEFRENIRRQLGGLTKVPDKAPKMAYGLTPEEEKAIKAKTEEIIEKMSIDPELREEVHYKVKQFTMMAQSLGGKPIKVRPGLVWSHNPATDVFTYPLPMLVNNSLESILGTAIHESMHRFGTFYQAWLPFADSLTYYLFNAVEDPRVEFWARLLRSGYGKYIDAQYKWDDMEWLDSLMGEGKPAHIRFARALVYMGNNHKIPPIIGEDDPLYEKLESVTEGLLEAVETTIPMQQNEDGSVTADKNPSRFVKMAHSRKAAKIINEKILPVYKKLLEERAEEMMDEESKSEETGEQPEGKPEQMKQGKKGHAGDGKVDLDDLPEDIKQKLQEELKKNLGDMDDKTKQDSPEWNKFEEDKKGEETPADPGEEAGEGKQDKKDGKEADSERPLTAKEKLERYMEKQQRIKEQQNLYQELAYEDNRWVNSLSGEMANLIREDSNPKWLTGQSRGKEIDWNRFMESAAAGFYNLRFWMSKVIPTKRSMKITLLMDSSGSMDGERAKYALRAARGFIDILTNLQIDYNIRAFGEETFLHKGFKNQIEKGLRTMTYTIQQKNELLMEMQETIGKIGSTHDVAALNAALDDIQRYGGDNNMIIVLTDGEGNGPGSMPEALERARKMGVKVIGVGIGAGITHVEKTYDSNVQVNNLEELPNAFRKILKRELERFYHAPRALIPLWPKKMIQKVPEIAAALENLIFQGLFIGVGSYFLNTAFGLDIRGLIAGTVLLSTLVFTMLHYKLYFDLKQKPEYIGFNPLKFARERLAVLKIGLGMSAVFGFSILASPILGGILGLAGAVSMHLAYNRKFYKDGRIQMPFAGLITTAIGLSIFVSPFAAAVLVLMSYLLLRGKRIPEDREDMLGLLEEHKVEKKYHSTILSKYSNKEELVNRIYDYLYAADALRMTYGLEVFTEKDQQRLMAFALIRRNSEIKTEYIVKEFRSNKEAGWYRVLRRFRVPLGIMLASGIVLLSFSPALTTIGMLWDLYSLLLDDHALITKVVTAFGLGVLGDYLAQKVQQRKIARDYRRTDRKRLITSGLRIAAFGGVMLHYWYAGLEYLFPGTGVKAVISKIIMMAVTYMPVLHLLNYPATVIAAQDDISKVFSVKTFSDGWRKFRKLIWSTTKMDLVYWALIMNPITFFVLPVELRVVFQNIVNIPYLVWLSWKSFSRDLSAEKEHSYIPVDEDRLYPEVCDETGRIFLAKHLEKDKGYLGHKDKNDYRRELLAYMIGAGRVNTVEIRKLSAGEIMRLKTVRTSEEGYYLTRRAQDYSLDELVQRDADPARSAILVFNTLIGKYDAYVKNRYLYDNEIPVVFDHDAAFDTKTSFAKFVHWYRKHVLMLVDKAPEHESSNFDIREIYNSINRFKALKGDFPEMVRAAGYTDKAEIEEVTAWLEERADSLEENTEILFEVLTGVDFAGKKAITGGIFEKYDRRTGLYKGFINDDRAMFMIRNLYKDGFIKTDDIEAVMGMAENNVETAKTFSALDR